MKTENKQISNWQWIAYNGCPIETPKGVTQDYCLDTNSKTILGIDLVGDVGIAGFNLKDCKPILRSMKYITKKECKELVKVLIVNDGIVAKYDKDYPVVTILLKQKDGSGGEIRIFEDGKIYFYGACLSFFSKPAIELFYDKGIAFGLHPDSWVDVKTLKK